jgi:hypothetical protein
VREWSRAAPGQGLAQGRVGKEKGPWVIDVPETITAQGNQGLGELCTLRRKHDWGATDGEKGVVWAARDAPRSRALCTIRLLEPGTFKSLRLLRRGHISANHAIPLRGSALGRRMEETGMTVIGSFDGAGKLRACKIGVFYAALREGPTNGWVPLDPSMSWLARVGRADGRNVWDLLEDRSLLKMVPADAIQPTIVAAALEFITRQVLRRPPVHPREHPQDRQQEASRPALYRREDPNDAKEPRHRYQWPRIAAVEYGDGWGPERDGAPREGKEVVLRIEGGMNWCPIAECVHQMGGRRREPAIRPKPGPYAKPGGAHGSCSQTKATNGGARQRDAQRKRARGG